MRISPLISGLIRGFIAAILQALFKVFPPPAYGICIACHTRDLVNWIINKKIFGTSLGLSPVSKVFPVLTIVAPMVRAIIT